MIEWLDAQGDPHWGSIESQREYEIDSVFSVGWLIHENEKRIILAVCVRPEAEQVSGMEYIPIGMIVRKTMIWDPKTDADWGEMWKRPFHRPEAL
jgi:hypothetical protein